MTEQENSSELIEVVLGLLEKSKQQDESMQKAIQEMKRQGSALETLRRAIEASAFTGVSLGVKNALETHNKALDERIWEIGSVTSKLQQTKKELNWKTFVWFYGSFALYMACLFVFAAWIVPSLDEIRERRDYLGKLNQAIEHKSELAQLQTSQCGGKLCVKVDTKQCGYSVKGSKGNGSYCIVNGN